MTREELSQLISQESHTETEAQQVLAALLDLPPVDAKELTTEAISTTGTLQDALGKSAELYDHLIPATEDE